MWSVKDEFNEAIRALNIGTESVCILNDEANHKLYFNLLEHFVEGGDRRWWREDFKTWFRFKRLDYPAEHLPKIIPDLSKKVLLMIEDDRKPYYPVYDVEPLMINKLLDECFGFEYYIINKDLSWLICETHHEDLIGVGDELKEYNKHRINSYDSSL
jgi:hypothetical protein